MLRVVLTLLVTLSPLALAGCTLPADIGCVSDEQCRVGRTCVDNRCVGSSDVDPSGDDSPNGAGDDVPNGGDDDDPTTSPRNIEQLDLLFVIDNTGSMCQEQRLLRENVDQLLETLGQSGVDFQIGITTTDMNGDYVLEPVAQPGHLQSTPQPLPGFDRSCHTVADAVGNPIPGDYEPIRETIAAAVRCMETPDDGYENVSDADIECGLYNSPQGCSIARAGCGGANPCTPEDLFPRPESYRSLPVVFRSSDYASGDGLDVLALHADLACATQVGTRGYGIEQGLAAAVEAVSPELTSDGGPNSGFLREDASFGLIFITDENDCSHDGTLPEDTPCGGDVCEFANREGIDSPLIAPETLKERLMTNLRESKGNPDFGESDVVVASIHGNYDRFDGDPPTDDECGSPDYPGITPTCATSLGVAFSGDRYERFLRSFPDGHYYPAANDPDQALTGWICVGDYRPALEAFGEMLTEPLP